MVLVQFDKLLRTILIVISNVKHLRQISKFYVFLFGLVTLIGLFDGYQSLINIFFILYLC